MYFPFVTGELEFQRRRSMVKVKQQMLSLSLFRMFFIFFSDTPIAFFFTPIFVTFCSISVGLSACVKLYNRFAGTQ